MNRVLFVLCLVLPFCGIAQAFLPRGGGSSPTAYVGPVDAVPGATHCWSLRACTAAYAAPGNNPALTYSCPGGSPSSGTINILTTGYYDRATLIAACGANHIDTVTMADQIGAYPFGQHVQLPKPSVAFGVTPHGKDAIFYDDSSSANFEGLLTEQNVCNTPMTMNAFSERIGTTYRPTTILRWESGPALGYNTGADAVFTGFYGGARFGATATDNVFHSLAGVLNGASSKLYVDGAIGGTGSLGTFTMPDYFSLGTVLEGDAMYGYVTEAILYCSGAISDADAVALSANQAAYW